MGFNHFKQHRHREIQHTRASRDPTVTIRYYDFITVLIYSKWDPLDTLGEVFVRRLYSIICKVIALPAVRAY
jgi:hypothetical protein